MSISNGSRFEGRGRRLFLVHPLLCAARAGGLHRQHAAIEVQTFVDSATCPSISCLVTIVSLEPSHFAVDIESTGCPPRPAIMFRLSEPSSL
jgi:hypothetical protein